MLPSSLSQKASVAQQFPADPKVAPTGCSEEKVFALPHVIYQLNAAK